MYFPLKRKNLVNVKAPIVILDKQKLSKANKTLPHTQLYCTEQNLITKLTVKFRIIIKLKFRIRKSHQSKNGKRNEKKKLN